LTRPETGVVRNTELQRSARPFSELLQAVFEEAF